jgi:hypothetical protein
MLLGRPTDHEDPLDHSMRQMCALSCGRVRFARSVMLVRHASSSSTWQGRTGVAGHGYGALVGGVGAAIDVTMVASLVAGLPLTIRAVRLPDPVAVDGGPNRLPAYPGFWLVAAIAAGYVNQVLFTIYVIKVHGGDASFIARYLPAGWFALADDNRVLQALAAAFPAPHLLAATVLRVQAALELPLIVLAYLTVCRWWDRRLYQSLTSPLPLTLASATYTITFCLIEWSLRNPYTEQDLVLRAISGLLTVVAVSRLARRTRAGDHQQSTRSALDLMVFGVSAAALGYLILAVYDTVLLYNLARVPGHLPGSLTALAALVAARHTARRRSTPVRPGVGIDTLTTGLGWFTALFFTPALPIRYALGFATPALAAAATVVITMIAAILTGKQVYNRLPSPRGSPIVAMWLAQSTAAALIGVAASSTARLTPPGYPEARLLLAAALFLATATITYALTDPLIRVYTTQRQPQTQPVRETAGSAET